MSRTAAARRRPWAAARPQHGAPSFPSEIGPTWSRARTWNPITSALPQAQALSAASAHTCNNTPPKGCNGEGIGSRRPAGCDSQGRRAGPAPAGPHFRCDSWCVVTCKSRPTAPHGLPAWLQYFGSPKKAAAQISDTVQAVKSPGVAGASTAGTRSSHRAGAASPAVEPCNEPSPASPPAEPRGAIPPHAPPPAHPLTPPAPRALAVSNLAGPACIVQGGGLLLAAQPAR